jgi:CRP-like cAMP-binding protein
MAKGGAEQQAIEAREIDAIIDHASSNVVLLPAARSALQEASNRLSAANREAADEAAAGNGVLAALPRAEYRRVVAGLEPVELKFGEVLHHPGAPIRHVYFPVDCVVSLAVAVAGHKALEVGQVGHEGMVGISLALGVDVSSVRALVQAPGTALRMTAERFRAAFQQSPPLQREVYRYACAMLVLARQTVACTRFHAIEARLARALLMTGDRLLSEKFFLTQDFLGDTLGVRRSTINLAAVALQRRKLISYSRGNVSILDRKRLEAVSCRCYTRIEGDSGPRVRAIAAIKR